MDGFRALAAFWVVFHHIFYFFKIDEVFYGLFMFFQNIFSINLNVFLHSLEQILRTLAFYGSIGVDMFFVISGFLITGLLMENLGDGGQLIRFYIRRAFKILPQYFFAVFCAFILYVLIPPFTVTDGAVPQVFHVQGAVLWSYVFFLQNYFIQVPMLAHTWSLVVEEHFYFFYPIILWLICLTQKEVEDRRRAVIMVCFLVLIVCNAIRFFYGSGVPWLNIFLPAQHYFETTLFRVDALAMGCLLKLFEPRIVEMNRLGKYWAFFPFLLAVLIYVLFYMGKISNQGNFIAQRWYACTLAYLAPFLVFAAALGGFSPLKGIVENPCLRFIGRNSYGIYLWHYILIFPATFLVSYWGTACAIIAYFFATLAVGVLTTTTIERYFLFLRSKIAP